MADAGELFVRLRPSAAGFTSEAQGPIAAAGRDLSKVFLAAFAVGGIATTITSVVKAATEHQAAFAVLNQTVHDAGASNVVYGQSLEHLLEQEARLKGFSDEQLASAFQRLVSVTHDSERAFVDLGRAEDLARFRHIDLAAAALLVAKAEQGKYQSLQRVGIVVPQITAAEADLKKRHDELIATGYKLTQSDKERYAAALAAAKATDAQATSAEALAIVEQRTGGAAAAFANTASGQFARLQQDFHQFEVAIGTPLLSGLASAAEGAGSFFTKLSEGGDAAKVAGTAAHDVGVVLHDIGAVAEVAGPPLLAVAKAVEQVVAAIGAPALLAAYGTFKAISVATALAATAEGFYVRSVAASVPVVAAAAIENQALAVSEAEVAVAGDAAAAGGLGAFVRGVGVLGVAGAGGPVGLAVLGVAALAGGIVYLAGKEQSWSDLNHRATDSLQGLTDATNQQKTAVGALAQAAAAANVAQEQQKAADALAAIAKRTSELTVLGGSSENANALRLKQFVDALGQQDLSLQKTNPLLAHNVELIAALAKKTGTIPSRVDIQLLVNNQDPKAALDQIIGSFTTLSTVVGHAVAQAQANIEKANAAGLPEKVSGSFKFGPSKTEIDAANTAAQSAIQSLRDGITTDRLALTQLQSDMADAVRQGAQSVDQAVQSAKQNINSIGQSLASSIGTFIDKPLNDAAQRLSDAQDRIAAVYDRKSAELNAKIAAVSRQQAEIGLVGNKLTLSNLSHQITLPGGKTLSQDPTIALHELDALQASIARRTGSTDPALAAYILQYRTASLAVESDKLNLKKTALDATHTAATTGLQLSGDALKLRQDAAAHAKQQAATQIANLTDLLNKSAISLPAFDIALGKVLAKNHLTFISAARRDGIAFADTFAAQLTGIGLQEGALKAGPQRAGTGLLPSIVRPLDTLQQTQKQIAGIASQERAKQLDETKKQTTLLKQIRASQAGTSFFSSLGKNPGQQSKQQQQLVGVGG